MMKLMSWEKELWCALSFSQFQWKMCCLQLLNTYKIILCSPILGLASEVSKVGTESPVGEADNLAADVVAMVGLELSSILREDMDSLEGLTATALCRTVRHQSNYLQL